MTAPRMDCQTDQCPNQSFGKTGGLWLCDDCRVALIDEIELPKATQTVNRMVFIRQSDPVLECPTGHIYWEKIDLPMAMEAYTERLRGMLRCPQCGIKPRRGKEKVGIAMLTGERRREEIKKQGWTEVT